MSAVESYLPLCGLRFSFWQHQIAVHEFIPVSLAYFKAFETQASSTANSFVLLTSSLLVARLVEQSSDMWK